ncbi:MAG TPA: hypothetical protein VLL98_05695 [Rickettsiales bacterium]|nr:hypothetical protein [Rickettsiales bacterium]
MEIITLVYFVAFFILSVVLLVSIVVLKNEKGIDEINGKNGVKKQGAKK